MVKFFFSAGEPSGDVHAAALIETIKVRSPDAEFIGLGSTNMKNAGCRLTADMSQFAIMGIGQVIKQYFRFRKLLSDTKQTLIDENVDVVVLVDYPGFNWHVAQAAKELKIPIIYFMPPQIWAWAQHRVKKMKRLVDLVLCPLHFEWKWFKRRGCKAEYMGHPFFEEVRKKESDMIFLEEFYRQYGDAPVLTILVGSRKSEVNANLKDMLQTVKRVQKALPNIQPVFAAFNKEHESMIQEQLKRRNMSIPIYVGYTPELIRAAECCLAVSGSVSLELLANNKPSVIYYRVGILWFLIQRFFRRTRFITLVNLLGAGNQQEKSLFYPDSVWLIPKEPSNLDRSRMVFPEILTSRNRSAEAAEYLINWLSSPESLASQKLLLELLLCEIDTIESPLELAANVLLHYSEYE